MRKSRLRSDTLSPKTLERGPLSAYHDFTLSPTMVNQLPVLGVTHEEGIFNQSKSVAAQLIFRYLNLWHN